MCCGLSLYSFNATQIIKVHVLQPLFMNYFHAHVRTIMELSNSTYVPSYISYLL